MTRLLLHTASSKYNMEDGHTDLHPSRRFFRGVLLFTYVLPQQEDSNIDSMQPLATYWLAPIHVPCTTAALWGKLTKPILYSLPRTNPGVFLSAGPAVLQQAVPVSCFLFRKPCSGPTHSLGGSESSYLHPLPLRATSVSAWVSPVLSLQQAAAVPVPGEQAAAIPSAVPGEQATTIPQPFLVSRRPLFLFLVDNAIPSRHSLQCLGWKHQPPPLPATGRQPKSPVNSPSHRSTASITGHQPQSASSATVTGHQLQSLFISYSIVTGHRQQSALQP